ncbi:Short-chain dehydrogenase [Cnuella takakiae]|uniref:Short-chain dehydrogenase n=1 Tax=Cnuella takakiae TaxID=1302690 RepID=A0A1M5AYQ7_9BACT|nr:SDR family oxidoreductase [Cnuella takakiae]OLY93263.1 short-chain dehydrogenase [Cnuella takakiae]SHF35042.1 Short-chain dehydrogenase [Cnuella takakiae]
MAFSNLFQKTVVITGASSGAGRAIALRFAREGAHLVLAARREAALKEVAAACEETGGKAIVVVCDVTDAEAVKQLAHEAFITFGGIDVWVNNAGVLAAGTFEETPIAVHDQVIRTNLMGYIHGAHSALPYFKRQGKGVLINNISVGGWFPTPYAVGYSASKFGLRGFSEALRGELHRYPEIHVCDMFPAFLDTPGMQHAANYTGRYLKPAPPVFDPQKVAEAAVALALRPRNSVNIGFMTSVLKTAHALAPALSRNATALSIEGYLKVAQPLPDTPGNVFGPVEYGTGIHGGWNSPADAEKRKKTGLMILAGLTLGWLLLAGRK